MFNIFNNVRFKFRIEVEVKLGSLKKIGNTEAVSKCLFFR